MSKKKTYINGWPVNRNKIIIKKLGDTTFQDRIINIQSKKLGLLIELVNEITDHYSTAPIPANSIKIKYFKEELTKIIENRE
jgi:hypothetical protein